MTDLKLKTVTPGKLNKPAWFRTRTAELGPDQKAGEGTGSLLTADVYLDGERIGSVTGALRPNSAVRDWTPDRIGAGIKQHGTIRFHAIDALVRTHDDTVGNNEGTDQENTWRAGDEYGYTGAEERPYSPARLREGFQIDDRVPAPGSGCRGQATRHAR
ncbi:hypothetical protein [Arthrobacter sp. 9MFCol3.1]|uniref:hypothetical protein n=1 Tax=Arthrobacter sp. 9MFCol3.1 TaxID=1150398 RepID=UPI00047AA50D|nr:hypothetical protein [Arthrobacter sp. 9MFCol3.1]